MNVPPRENTQQEKIIASVLSDMGLRYNEQEDIGPYTVDFWISELGMVIEADGLHGHFKNREIVRDTRLMQDVEYVLHIKDTSYIKIKEVIWTALTTC